MVLKMDKALGVGIRQVVVIGLVGKPPRKFLTTCREGVGDVLEEDEAEDDVLVLGGIHVGAELVGGGPEGFLDGVDHFFIVRCDK